MFLYIRASLQLFKMEKKYKASGKEHVTHNSFLINHIKEQLYNPDMADVIFTVGEKEFIAHRFVLGVQSTVFQTMLFGEKWKESSQVKIKLAESPIAETAFEDFLKFFYTGKNLHFGGWD